MIKVREMDIEFYRNYFNTLEKRYKPEWRYDEMKSCGAKFNSLLCARKYDKQHRKFRDYQKESQEIIAQLALDHDQSH